MIWPGAPDRITTLIGQIGGLIDVVGDEEHRLRGALPECGSARPAGSRESRASSAEKGSSISRISRLDRERTGQRNALALPTGELMRPAPGEHAQAYQIEHLLRSWRASRRTRDAAFETEADIGDDLAPGQQRRESWKTVSATGRRPWSLAWMTTSPPLGLASPAITRSRVDLPTPDEADDGQKLAAADREVELAQHLGLLAIAVKVSRQGRIDRTLLDHAFQRSTHFWKATKAVSSSP